MWTPKKVPLIFGNPQIFRRTQTTGPQNPPPNTKLRDLYKPSANRPENSVNFYKPSIKAQRQSINLQDPSSINPTESQNPSTSKSITLEATPLQLCNVLQPRLSISISVHGSAERETMTLSSRFRVIRTSL